LTQTAALVRQDCTVELGPGPDGVNALIAAFDLGADGHVSDGPVARGRLGSIWRLDTDRGSWAVKVEQDLRKADMAELLDGAAFQEAAAAAGVGVPGVRRTGTGDVFAVIGDSPVRVFGWIEMDPPDLRVDAAAIGRLVAALHCTPFAGTIGEHPWYSAPVGERRWQEIVAELQRRQAPFADEIDALIPEVVALERWLGAPPRDLRTCHRDLWADNVRRTSDGTLCVFDFDNAGLADPSQELAAILVEYAGSDPSRASRIRAAYEEAGGPGRVERPTDFAMPIAQLAHIAEEGCRRWLVATTDEDRADNEAWVREYLDRPLTRAQIESLLGGDGGVSLGGPANL
jgi:aminoglycoside phosphotransferase (APT) family kinase protein